MEPQQSIPAPLDPTLWAQLPPEAQMHWFNYLRGMESARPGLPMYGPHMAMPGVMQPPTPEQAYQRVTEQRSQPIRL